MRLYNDYNSYLREKYGCKVYRIGLDAGFSCPNRDGTKGFGGCIYCNEEGSRASYADPALSVAEQLRSRIKKLREKNGPKKYIAYFQAFTNTYAPAKELRPIYDQAASNDVVGISIGTRPDAIDLAKLELIASYKDRYEVWIEYGLQSAHDKTLLALQRGHTFADFANAVHLTKRFGISVCGHVILGLPGETAAEMMETADKLSELKVDGVKIHLLHILKGSRLEQLYAGGKIRLPEQDEYVELVCDFLERLSPDIVIQRLTGEGTREKHVAPLWALDKLGTIKKIEETLKKRGSRQGTSFEAAFNPKIKIQRSKLHIKT
ncbi:MAG: TIGR01212 family radical SAM protein [Candidatus Omnitrophica bacterium]|nr:TIGR01212 family radical SAM protein [Candidatus Omnitrophota bacterium]